LCDDLLNATRGSNLAAQITVARTLCSCITLAVFAHAACSNGVVIVQGKVENPPRDGTVRVELVYPKQQGSDSGDTTIENESFTLKVPFFTQSRAPLLNNNFSLREKCSRKPSAVIVTLRRADQEYDRVSLDISKDFETPYPGAYALRSRVLLHGPN
jgi:hypothetical protein